MTKKRFYVGKSNLIDGYCVFDREKKYFFPPRPRKADCLNDAHILNDLHEKYDNLKAEKWEMSSLKFESDTANLLQKRKINVKDSIIEVFFKKSLHNFFTKVNEDIKNNNVVNTPIGFELLYKNCKYRIVMFAQQEELKE